tara:strand:+ start:246 stop:674 length:429 start_codon:yes stop_codon:yes gene_type:complete
MAKKRLNPLNYLWTDHRFLDSDATKKLTGSAFRVLGKFQYFQRCLQYREDQNYIVFTYGQAKEMGIAHATFKRSLRLLHEVGFIDVTYSTLGKAHLANHYKLSKRWVKYGNVDFINLVWPEGLDHSQRFGNPPKLTVLKASG